MTIHHLMVNLMLLEVVVVLLDVVAVQSMVVLTILLIVVGVMPSTQLHHVAMESMIGNNKVTL